jgi:hypothetical protein
MLHETTEKGQNVDVLSRTFDPLKRFSDFFWNAQNGSKRLSPAHLTRDIAR